jgi:K+-sensing histidine kinase KdpD
MQDDGGDRPEQRLRHDLRQSLSTVMMLAAIVDRQPLDGPEIRSSLEQMLHEVDWMKEVVACQACEDAALVDVGEAVAAVWEPEAAVRACSLRLVRESQVWAWTDPVALGRSVRNLLDNAIRAAGDEGEVEVRVTAGHGTVVIEVGDSGPGFGLIRPQERLGLLTVRRFASEQNGRLLIERSQLGGALMRLVLPVAMDAEPVLEQTRTTA